VDAQERKQPFSGGGREPDPVVQQKVLIAIGRKLLYERSKNKRGLKELKNYDK